MRRRNREINIFNLSMLDVIAGAMAAFLIIMIVLMPYYRKEHIDYQAIVAELQRQLAQAQHQAQAAAARTAAAEEAARAAESAAADAAEQVRAAQAAAAAANAQAQQQRERAEGLERRLAKTFLVLYVRWNTRDDIDLHVIDPSGAEFSFQRKTISGRPGELSEDTINGPGNEVWEIRDAPPGDYRVLVHLYAVKDSTKPVSIQGRVFHRDDSHAFSTVHLRTQGETVPVATIVVDAQGGVSVR
ncbi:YfaP family protein [Lamprocystis purpurea]|uniref:YfaP family protein n=1 Tax=Lamprocystis purpurea TaxID=61598 RepID=UPI00037597B1|nr:hypothetical protein [Lamprocystis purpurea]